jgi:hypothetical protein
MQMGTIFWGNWTTNHAHNLLIEFFIIGGLLGLVLAISNLVNVIVPLLNIFWINDLLTLLLHPYCLDSFYSFSCFLQIIGTIKVRHCLDIGWLFVYITQGKCIFIS